MGEISRADDAKATDPMTTPLPDAAPTNWVDRHAPAALRPWLKLARLDRPTGIWLLMLPGWQGIALADAMRAMIRVTTENPDQVLERLRRDREH